MASKQATINLRGAQIKVRYVTTYEGDVEEWKVLDRALEPTLTEAECQAIDAQLYEIESGEPLNP